MKREEVIERFCKLSSEVGEHMGHRFAHDCFCHEGVHERSYSTFQFEDPVMNFIVNAVEDKINGVK